MSSAADPLGSAMKLFDRFVEADPEQRAALLADLLEHHPDVHAHLTKLIAADGAAQRAHFLDDQALSDVPREDAEPSTEEGDVNRECGPWRLERLLGSGGAGHVWLAQRSDGLHEGKAAIKLLRGAVLDASIQQRFAREGRLLARLEHPHIARLLDVGEDARGQRFLVLQFIDGERIDAFCDRNNVSIDERLRLFLQVCDAVSYAHANLVVHRDLKPSNILVERKGTAKLLDFGIAKLLDTDDESRELTELTRTGSAPFTPEYAAPEQFENQPITVATDVYSLGAVLYLLLAGRRPSGDVPPTRTRAVEDVEPLRLSLAGATQEARRIARLRATTPQHLRRMLRGDLETIVSKALKRNPKERYPSVQALAGDVQRYLDGLPILARGDGNLYRARKFVARHRLGVLFAAIMSLTLIGAGTALLIQAQRLKREAARATTIKNLLLESFVSADPNRTGGEPAGDISAMVKRASRRIDDEAGVDDETRAEAHTTLGNLFTEWNRYDEAQENYHKAWDIYRRLYGDRSLQALDLEERSVFDEMHHGRFAHLMPRVDRLLTDLGGPTRSGAEWRRLRWGALEVKARTARGLGDLPAARAIAEQRTVEVRAAGAERGDEYSSSLELLIWIANDEGAPAEAERLLLEAIALDQRLYPRRHEQMTVDLLSAVEVLTSYGDDRDAEPLARQALEQRVRGFGPHHIGTSWAYSTSAVVADNLGHDEEAERYFSEAAAIAAEVHPPNPNGFAVVRYAHGVYLLRRGQWSAASAEFADCVHDFDDFDETPGVWHWRRAACAVGLAYCTARATGDKTVPATLDRLIAEERLHRARELPTALWLRARLADEHVTEGTPREQLALLDEGAAVLRFAARDGSRIGRDIEAARRALGAPPGSPTQRRGEELVGAADGIVAAAADAAGP